MKFLSLLIFAILLQACSQQEVFTSQAIKQFSHSEQALEHTALSHDGKFSLSAIATGVCLWNNQTDKLHIPCLTGEASKFVEIVGISQNNQFFFTSNQVVVRLYNANNGKQLGEWQLAENIINDIAISANGDTLLFGTRSGIAAIIDTRSQKITSYQKHKLDINSVSLSADGQRAFTGSSDKTAQLWHTATGETIYSLAHKSRVNHVTISEDGSLGVSLDAIKDHTIWDLNSGQAKASLDTHLRFFEFNTARFSADNKWLLAGLPKRKVQLWRVNDGVKLAEWLAHQQRARAAVLAVAFINDKQIATENSDGLLEIWDLPPLN